MAQKNFYHPFNPYDIQQQFMESVYDCIENGKVGIFESPTGTGKSLSLICGSLTWLREHKRRTFDDAMATIELEDGEPDWMADHAREVRNREIRQMREDLEKRLAAVRERERKVKERQSSGEPVLKKQKRWRNSTETADEEEQFVLDHYESDDEQHNKPQGAYSAETTKLMQEMGLLLSKESREKEEEAEELKIYFCSRTHSQLSQFISELRRVRLPSGLPPAQDVGTNSNEELRHLTLGSRKNLCINPAVSRLPTQTAINERCVELQQTSTPADKKCSFLPRKETEGLVLDFRDHALATIRDIEDLARLGSKLQVCPYYASRPGIRPAEIVTLPYPLLLQKSAREALGISLKGQIVIIDEAHNLMNTVEGIYSASISDEQLKRAKESLILYLQKFRNRLKGSNRTYVTQLVRVINSLLQFTDGLASQAENGNITTQAALLGGKNVDQINLGKLVRYINESKLARKVEGYVTFRSQADIEKKQNILARIDRLPEIPTLTSVQNFLTALMNPSQEGRFMWSKTIDNGIRIQYLLLDTSEHFRDIVEDARAVILAGGTMSPMDEYKQQLFPYLESVTTFACGHLIPPTNLFVRAITSDTAGRLDFSFKARNDTSATRLGNALIETSRQVKGGTVVFLPSYGYLEKVVDIWKSGTTMLALEEAKAIFLDSRTGSAEDTFRAYSDKVRSDDRGALLLSVVGGKLSEGINFSDDLGRCVVVVGLPYPNLDTPEWRAKMRYLDERAVANGGTAGKASREHAENVCMRSVNQAIGRVIRHKDDWASILLFDARYAEDRIQAKLPGWIKTSSIPRASGLVTDVVKDLRTFFDARLR